MPWEIILSAIGGSTIPVLVMVVLGLTIAQRIGEKAVDTFAHRLKGTTTKAEDTLS